jgi:hypothetical protein
MSKQIESTGHKKTIKEREADAISRVENDLTRCRQILQLFGKMRAVGFCEKAIAVIRKERH